MTTLYKLMSKENETHGGTIWGEGVIHGPLWGKGGLCGPGWFHAYTHPLLAVLFDPIHGTFGKGAIMRRAEGIVGKTDHGIKVGCRTLATFEQIPLPVISTTRRVAFGILTTLESDQPEIYREWARHWLSATDRSATAAESARALARARAATAAKMSAEVWLAAVGAAAAGAASIAAAGPPADTEIVAADAASIVATCKSIDLITIAEQACNSTEEKWEIGRRVARTGDEEK